MKTTIEPKKKTKRRIAPGARPWLRNRMRSEGWTHIPMTRRDLSPIWYRLQRAFLTGALKEGDVLTRPQIEKAASTAQIADMVVVQMELAEYRSPLLIKERPITKTGQVCVYEIAAR